MNHFEVPGELHSKLNPKLWDGEHLKTKVAVALLKIAKAYYEFLGVNAPVIDVVMSGSQSNFNYSSHSDIDLHLIMPYEHVQCDMEVIKLFDTKRKLWKEQHDISIFGIPVEVYVEDEANPAISSTYSIVKSKWISPPEKLDIKTNPVEIEQLALTWIKAITAAIKTQDLEQCEMVKTLLWAYRKAGLAKEGEMGISNLTFKALRNSGITQMLLDAVHKLDDRKLSL